MIQGIVEHLCIEDSHLAWTDVAFFGILAVATCIVVWIVKR